MLGQDAIPAASSSMPSSNAEEKAAIDQLLKNMAFFNERLNKGVPEACKKDFLRYFNCRPALKMGKVNWCNGLNDSAALTALLKNAVKYKSVRAFGGATAIWPRLLLLPCFPYGVINAGGRLTQGTPKGVHPARQLAFAIRDSGDIASWFADPRYIMQAIIDTNDSTTKVELIKALQTHSIPMYWFYTIKSRIKEITEQLLSEMDLPVAERQALKIGLTDVESRITAYEAERAAAEAMKQAGQLVTAQTTAAAASTGNPLVDTPLGPAIPPKPKKTNWTPYIVLGGVGVTAVGAITALLLTRK